ncbi:hypothetical protein LL270_08925 [Pseudomonas aestusnigri]|uniref:hypothetical protein n=1 Tax=Halopseudomonas aestusnigri TaxID=857252 RepID=UPI001D18D0C4|nr:hypothetical protein [Halopseudomonas aestusnigri]MCC4260777.1 hypothetical protein [Halopseudomonas aestusnigri]
MAANDCIAAIEAAAKASGRGLTVDEMTEIVEDLQGRIKLLQATNDMLSLEDAALRAADELGNQLKLAAAIEKRNAAMNARRRAEAIGYVRSVWADRPDLGLESFLVGTNVARTGARRSVAAEQKQLADSYIAGFLNDIEQAELLPFLTKGDLDQDITDALWRLGTDRELNGLSKQAVGIAKIMQKYQEAARLDANRAGAFIRKLPGYIVRQSHDPYKLQRAGFPQWRDTIRPLLAPGTLGADPASDDALLQAYNGLVSGVHLKTSTPEPTGFKGPRNLAKKLSQERVLHFKDGIAWHEYNQVFGTGSLREAFLGGMMQMGESTGLLRRLGTNPEANWTAILDELQRDLKDDAEAMSQFQNDRRGMLATRFAEVDGSSRIAVNQVGARVSSNIRAWQSMAKLGGAVVSAVTDLPVAASELRYQGRGMLGSMGELIGGLVSGRKSDEQKEILSSLGVFFDNVRGEVISRFSADDTLGSKMTRMQRHFFKWNGLTWWTDTMRSTAALMMSHHLAYNRSLGWDQMNPDLRNTLELFGVDAGKWDLLRSTATKQADGREYMTTQGIDDIPAENLSAYLEGQGRAVNDAAVNELREELRGNLRSYITDRASYAVIEPDARTRAIMRRGTRPGTIAGELLRFIGQFKAFPVAILQKSVGRELYGRGYSPSKYGSAPGRELQQALLSGRGETLGLAQLMLWTTLFGYGAMSAKDMLKGRNPRPPEDASTWVAAMMQGGALGIYGDFLFGESNRLGGGIVGSLAGPTAGAFEGGVDLWFRLRDGDDAASASFRYVINNTPYANLFYTRAAADYLFLYSVQEALNPGALRRMERRIEKENGQTFLLSPSRDYMDPLGLTR